VPPKCPLPAAEHDVYRHIQQGVSPAPEEKRQAISSPSENYITNLEKSITIPHHL
jgi:hypothetical protein